MLVAFAAIVVVSVGGCQGTGYVLEDIQEGALSLVGQGPTTSDRLDRLAETHDRAIPTAWKLLPRGESSQPQRRALREMTLLEREKYSSLAERADVLVSLAPYAVHSDSTLIRARAVRAVALLAAPFELNPARERVEAKEMLRLLEAQAAAQDAYEKDQNDETRRAFVAASVPIARFRFWPLERPIRESPNAAVARIARTRRIALAIRRAADESDITEDEPVAVGIRSLIAEHARLLAAFALVHDDEAIVRADAVEALSELGDPESVGVLAAASKRELDGSVRRRIARALAQVGGGPAQRETVVPALIRLAGDPDDDVRHHALSGLRTVTGVDHGTDLEAWQRWWDAAQG